MSTARVQSIEAIQRFVEHLQTFRLALVKELESLDLELRRVSTWINEDAQDFWRLEQQTNARKLAENLQQLSRCMSYVRSDEQRPCTEEKKRVARAKERAQLCETKIRLGKAASLHWESRAAKVTTKVQRCQDMAEADLQIAINLLRRHLELLNSYAQLNSDFLRETGSSGSNSAGTEPPVTGYSATEYSRTDLSNEREHTEPVANDRATLDTLPNHAQTDQDQP